MKRIASLLLALVMACSAITGCSQNNTPQRTESPFTDTPKIEHENTEKTSETSKTEPPATEPTTTQPTETEPTTTQPPETEPTTTQPPETEPTTTQPPETEPPETEPSVVETTPEPTNNDGNMIDGMRADFKKAMDDYEAFIDEYIEFMKKYSESDGSSLTLLADYLEFLEKYNEMSESMDKWESEDMNDIERAYYLEVLARCNKKMLESLGE